MRTLLEVVKGWIYLIAFITGGNFVRKSRLRRAGKSLKISPTAFLKHPENIEIGDNVFINHLCSIWAAPEGSIRIGNDVLFGPNVSVIASNHGIALGEPMRLQPGRDADITIGDDCWIGANAVITAGVTLGNGVVVGAGAIVTKDLPPLSVCAGVPAKVLRFRSG